MGYARVLTPSLPCPYCLDTFSTHLPDAAWMGGEGADPDRTVLEIHMAGCDRKPAPAATGFVEASELLGRSSESFGLS